MKSGLMLYLRRVGSPVIDVDFDMALWVMMKYEETQNNQRC
jgi:hypothetical protein